MAWTFDKGNAFLDVHSRDHRPLHRRRHGAEVWHQEEPKLLGTRLWQNPPGAFFYQAWAFSLKNCRASTWSMPRDTATHRLASVWNSIMRTLANCSVLIIQPTARHMRLVPSSTELKVPVLFDWQHLHFTGVWRTRLPCDSTLHLGYRAGREPKTSFLCSLPISGGTDCTDFLAVQRQPDLDQEEQQHVHPLWRDGFLADERHSRQSTDRCLKYELRYLMTCDLATYLLNI